LKPLEAGGWGGSWCQFFLKCVLLVVCCVVQHEVTVGKKNGLMTLLELSHHWFDGFETNFHT